MGATHVWAQTSKSVNAPVGGGTYYFTAADFGFSSGVIVFESLPARGNFQRYSNGNPAAIIPGIIDDHQATHFFADAFGGAGSDDRLEYRTPADAVSIATGYTSFIYQHSADGGITRTMFTMTINLAGASTPTAASGAPTIAATDTHRIRASITGVTDRNGIDVGTLSWQWQQAAAPASGVPETDDYDDIEDATSSLFAPTAAQLSRYVRTCVSFKDQSPTPASEGPLCSAGLRVTELPSEIRLRLRLFLEGPLR